MKKLYICKTFSKMARGRGHTPHPTPLHPPLDISYKNHLKSLAYFSHLAPLVLLRFTKRQSEKRRTGKGSTMPPLNTLLTALNRFCDMIIIGKK